MTDNADFRPYQRINALKDAFPFADPFVMTCCSNDGEGLDRAGLIALFKSKYEPIHDELAAERKAFVLSLQEGAPPILKPTAGNATTAEAKPKKTRDRLQGLGGGGSKPKVDQSKPQDSMYSGGGSNNNGATFSLTHEPRIRPGIVHLKGALTPLLQQHFIHVAEKLGSLMRPDLSSGWYRVHPTTGRSTLNNVEFGQMREPITSFPTQFKEVCEVFLATVRELDPTLPVMDPTMVLLNYYPSESNGMYWHRDNSKGEMQAAKLGSPVVSFSLGDACVFSVKDEHEDPQQDIVLESGDVLVFGGPSRMVLHSVTKIYPGSAPKSLKFQGPPGRINMTFRQSL